MKNKMTRKKFISTTGKYVGGVICTPMMLSLMSCKRVTGPDGGDGGNDGGEGVMYTSVCACHNSQFNQDGVVLHGPATVNLISYDAEIVESEILVTIDNQTESIDINDHPDLENIGGVSHIDDSMGREGLLLYRKSEDEILVFDRECTHSQCPINPFTATSV